MPNLRANILELETTSEVVVVNFLVHLITDKTMYENKLDREYCKKIFYDVYQVISSRGKQDIFNISKGSSPMQELMLQVLGAFAQFERKLIRERQQEGINNAKRQGKHLGRPKKLSDEDKKLILEMHNDGCLPAFIANKFDVSVSSVYKVIKQYKEK